MAHQLAFHQLYHYEEKAGIPVPVILSAGREALSLLANVDTGAGLCIFRREHGEALGLPIERGLRQRVRTVTGSFETFGHMVSLDVLGLEFESLVYFAVDPHLTRAVLGRSGFLDRVRLGLIDYDRRLYLSRYEDLA